eukprot:TRINITY_DN2853_c0_g1::TRINITY_DN2853_c0_g1_i1::g.5156::m.5156 TRINITY_DN2853_c0_g1::TRINITY_DN2853_c0_g1_i1::g.5156  ORF type:complete len:609 (+),score=215.19,sp/A7H3B9/PCKA_CAMJD/62.43/0.0,PEPCK_ATP/PF01293.15/1.5e-217,AAA_24/PF13479.1/0.15 TRINITY_DN2853_c0_g1_i1:36-1829(+)
MARSRVSTLLRTAVSQSGRSATARVVSNVARAAVCSNVPSATACSASATFTGARQFHASPVASAHVGELKGKDIDALGLKKLGLNLGSVHRNISYDELREHEMKNKEGRFASTGAFMVDTGKFTGRSPKDKYFVKQAPSDQNIWWGSVNHPCTPEVWDELYAKVTKHYEGKHAYIFDGFSGAHEESRKAVRFVSEYAWQSHFVRNMFIRPEAKDLEKFAPQFTVINACNVVNSDYKKHGMNSDVFVVFNVEKNVAIIGGTFYGGEMKKGIFSMMNYWLPLQGHLSMHCSANKGPKGDTALFFGLSGTGKTTLSADPNRTLIGDDEHGWDDKGTFNFEGGCYAKTINLSKENEPIIWDCIKKDAMLENCVADDKGVVDYDNVSKTQNTRVSYPLYHVANHDPTMSGGHPNNIIFLTCDAYGVLPPVSHLTPEQAMYHYLSGYTAKVAGTERGVNEPEATFSACFGSAFLPLHPTKYAKLLGERMRKYNSNAWLVNTGWSAGAYGVGKRMPIPVTRHCIDAIHDGSLAKANFTPHPVFKVGIPDKVNGVDSKILNPINTWSDKAAYDATCKKLAGMFIKNFEQYKKGSDQDYSKFGPQL